MNEKKYFALKYSDDAPGCPTYLAAELNPTEREWDLFVPDPSNIKVQKKYTLKITDPDISSIDFDMDSGDQKYVSQQFLDICDSLNVPYKAIPLEIKFSNGERSKKDYFFFLPGLSLQLLNRSLSTFEEEMVLGSDQIQMNGIFPECPIYAKISKFVPLQIRTGNLFFCIETFELVCTSEFRDAATKNGLVGISYTAIDENYIYDAWGDNS